MIAETTASTKGRASNRRPFVRVFVDFDGTITDLDTFDVLVRAAAGREPWDALEARLHTGALTLREVLEAQAALVHMTLDEADALLRERTRVDPSFARLVERCEAAGTTVSVVSSGVAPLIERALARHGLERVAIYANGIDPSPNGWRFHFRDDSENGHDKAAAVRSAREDGAHTIFIGDGPSDYAAAIVADERYAKKGRALEAHLQARGVPFSSFVSMAEVVSAIFNDR